MTIKEIEIQIALGTLPYKEYMKLDINLKNGWWYFPLEKESKYIKSNTILIDNIVYYRIADGYIDQLFCSMKCNGWTEAHFAREIIESCYSCISMETIDL